MKPSQGFPVLGRALSTTPVPPTSPVPRPPGLVLAVGDADPDPGMGQDVCVPPRVSAVDCNQPLSVPLLPEPRNPHLQPPTAWWSPAPSPVWPSPPSWSISKQQRRERSTREHTAVRRVIYSCASSCSPGQDSEPPRTSPWPLGTQG